MIAAALEKDVRDWATTWNDNPKPLSTAAVARAFLVSEATMAARTARAKKKTAAARIGPVTCVVARPREIHRADTPRQC